MPTAITKPTQVTRAEFARQETQPVIGSPSILRLGTALKEAGFNRVRLKLDDDQEFLRFTLRPGPELEELKGDSLLNLLIRTFRSAGFKVGWEELAVHSTEAWIKGFTLTGPIERLARNRDLEIEGA